MALDATEGEQALLYAESRREPLWLLLQAGMNTPAVPAHTLKSAETLSPVATKSEASSPKKNSRKRAASTEGRGKAAPKETETAKKSSRQKRQTHSLTQTVAQKEEDLIHVVETTSEAVAQSSEEAKSFDNLPQRKRQTGSKKVEAVMETPNSPISVAEASNQNIEPAEVSPPQKNKRQGRVGQRKPKRDPVGS